MEIKKTVILFFQLIVLFGCTQKYYFTPGKYSLDVSDSEYYSDVSESIEFLVDSTFIYNKKLSFSNFTVEGTWNKVNKYIELNSYNRCNHKIGVQQIDQKEMII